MKKEQKAPVKLEQSSDLVSSFIVKSKPHFYYTVRVKEGQSERFSHQVIFITFPDASFALKFISQVPEDQSSSSKKAIFIKIDEETPLEEPKLTHMVSHTEGWKNNFKSMFLVFKNNRMLEEVDPNRVRLWLLKERLVALKQLQQPIPKEKKPLIREHDVTILSEREQQAVREEIEKSRDIPWKELIDLQEDRHTSLRSFKL